MNDNTTQNNWAVLIDCPFIILLTLFLFALFVLLIYVANFVMHFNILTRPFQHAIIIKESD